MKKTLLLFAFLLFSLAGFSQTFSEGFENTTGPDALPSTNWTLGSGNWAVFDNGVGTSQRWEINNTPQLVHQGSNAAYISRENIGAGNTSEDYLATPAVTVPANGQLRFFTKTFTSGNQGTLYRIMVTPANNPENQTNPSAFVPIQEWSEANLNTAFNVYEEKIVDLSAFVGQQVYIAFVMVWTQPGTSLGDRWLVDDVSIQSSTECYLVNLSATYSSPSTINVTWGTNNPNPVEVMVLPCSEPAPAPTETGTIVNGTSYQFTNMTPNTCYRAYIKSSCPNNSAGNWMAVQVTLGLNSLIKLIAFIDTNNNGIKDPDEVNFPYGHFTVMANNSGNTSYLNGSQGVYNYLPQYSLYTYDFGFELQPGLSPYFSLGNFNFDDIAVLPQNQTLYFPIIQMQPYFDPQVIIYGPGITPNSTSYYNYVNIRGIGIDTGIPQSGTLMYTKPANTTILSVTPSAGIVFTPTGFTYDYSNLTLTNSIYLNILLGLPTIQLGDVFTSNAVILPANVDSNSTDNTFSSSRTVAASLDPNEIVESHGDKIQFDQFGPNDYLYYTIHFQNTGNADTATVKVENILDAKIDESTVSMVSASHDYEMERTDNHLSWTFDPIALTPTSVNEDQSQGYIIYKAKPKPGYAIGDIIANTASIYFDSNPAIVTNTFNTEFVTALGNPAFDVDAIDLYPNPASGLITIANHHATESIASIAIYDILGKKIFSKNNGISSETSIDISHFAKGMYLIELVSSNNNKITKKLILK